MSFGDYWLRLQAKNKGLKCDDTDMTITVEKFRAALHNAYLAGMEQAKGDKSVFDALFGSMRRK